MKNLLAPVTCILLLAGCTQAPPPVADTREADAKAIRETEAAWKAAWATKDPAKILPFWAEDATLMIPDVPTLKGAAAIAPVFKEVLADPGFSVKLETVTVEASKGGDFGYTQGTYVSTGTDPKSKRVFTEKGKYLTIFKKQADGSWKVVQDIWNPDAPAGPAPDAK